MASFFSRAWAAYSNSMKTHPMRTNIVTGGLITVISDSAAQSTDSSRRGTSFELDQTRTLSMLCWGTAVNGGAVTLWLRFLEKLFPSQGQTVGRVCQKVVFNQVMASPWLNGGFFGVATARAADLTTADGRAAWLASWQKKCREDLGSTLIASAGVWCPAHLINFFYVPPHLRVLYTNFIFFSWTVWLSYVGFKPPGTAHETVSLASRFSSKVATVDAAAAPHCTVCGVRICVCGGKSGKREGSREVNRVSVENTSTGA